MEAPYTLDFSFLNLPAFSKKIIGFERYPEGINKEYGIHLIFRTLRELPLKTLLGTLGEIGFSWKGQYAFLGGILKEYTQTPQEDGFEYACRFISPVEYLQFQNHNRVFVKSTLEDIIDTLFKNVNYLSVKKFFQNNFPVCEFIPQYVTNDYEFFKWLVKTYSLYYYTVYEDKCVQLILADSLQALPTREKKLTLCEGDGFVSSEALTYQCEKNCYFTENKFTEKISITTEDCTLCIGDIIPFNNHYYRVYQKKECFSVGEGFTYFPKEKQIAYYQSLQLIPLEQTVSVKNILHNVLLYPEEALIASPDDAIYLDETGGYRAQFLFDTETKNPIQGSDSLKKLQPFGGVGSQGFHFPLLPNHSSLVGFTAGDRRSPFLLGILFSEDNLSPVTSLSSHDYIWKSRGGNTMLFHQEDQKAYLSLHTLHQLQMLMFMESEKTTALSFINKTGDLVFSSEELFTIQNGGDEKAFITGKTHMKIGETFTLNTVKEDMQISAGKDIRLYAKDNVSIKTEKEMSVLSSQSISLISQEDFLLSMDKGKSLLQCLEGKFSLLSHGHVFFHSETGDIILLNGKASIVLRPNGSMSIKATSIIFKAENILIQNPVWVNG